MAYPDQTNGPADRSEEIAGKSDLSPEASAVTGESEVSISSRRTLTPEEISAKGDEELVALSLENQSFFSFLIRRYEGKLKRYVMRISSSGPEDAEDILQDVFIKVYRNLYGFDQTLKFSSWIYRIAHNQVVSDHRRKSARPQTDPLDIEDGRIGRLAADLDIDAEVDNRILRQNIDRILNALDIKYREALVLKFLEDKDYQAISDILEKPVGTVATLISRGKQKFREEMEKQDIKLRL